MRTAYWSPSLDAVLVERGGAFDVIGEAERDLRFTLPRDAVQMLDPDDAVAETLGRVVRALSSVKMSATTRRDVADALESIG